MTHPLPSRATRPPPSWAPWSASARPWRGIAGLDAAGLRATDRAFRIGQRRNVQVRKFICVGTLEEKIDEMIEDKKALANLVISDGEGWLTELSTNTLREVFALGARGREDGRQPRAGFRRQPARFRQDRWR